MNDVRLDRALSEAAYAANRTSFFRGQLAKVGLGPNDLRAASAFHQIPVSERKDFRRGFPTAVVADGFALDDPALFLSQSSGTSGDRLTTLESPIIYSARMLACASVHPSIRAAVLKQPRRHVRLAAPNCSAVACTVNVRTGMGGRTLPDGTLVLETSHDVLATATDTWISNIAEIESYQPSLYYADPVHLSALSRYAYAQGFELFPAPVVLTYSLVTRLARRQIARGFGQSPPVTALAVSMSELGWLALECPLGAVHLNTANYHVELRRNGRAAICGEPAEVLVTTLDQGCTPRIRYRTGDVFSLSGTACRCGHPFPVIEMEGRLADCIVKDGRVVLTPRGLDDIVGSPDWLDVYKLHQVDEDAFRLQLVVNDVCSDAAKTELAKRLREHLGARVLAVEEMRYISGTMSGKFSTCTSSPAQRLVGKGWTL